MGRHGTFGLDEFKLAKLARELTINAKPASEVLRDYGLTIGEFHEIEQNEFFRRTFEQMLIDWNSVTSTADRIRLFSATAIEQALPVLADRMKNREEPLEATVSVGKFLARNAGIGEPEREQTNQERFVITINLGADQKIKIDKPIAKDVTPALAAITKKDDD